MRKLPINIFVLVLVCIALQFVSNLCIADDEASDEEDETTLEHYAQARSKSTGKHSKGKGGHKPKLTEQNNDFINGTNDSNHQSPTSNIPSIEKPNSLVIPINKNSSITQQESNFPIPTSTNSPTVTTKTDNDSQPTPTPSNDALTAPSPASTVTQSSSTTIIQENTNVKYVEPGYTVGSQASSPATSTPTVSTQTSDGLSNVKANDNKHEENNDHKEKANDNEHEGNNDHKER